MTWVVLTACVVITIRVIWGKATLLALYKLGGAAAVFAFGFVLVGFLVGIGWALAQSLFRDRDAS